jgi:hypothetical protein
MCRLRRSYKPYHTPKRTIAVGHPRVLAEHCRKHAWLSLHRTEVRISPAFTTSVGMDLFSRNSKVLDDVTLRLKTNLLLGIVPALLVSLAFYFLLGHRRDYLGHYAAGYGGTLCAIAIVFAAIPATHFAQLAVWTVVPTTILCIAAGTVTEATVFRLAKFDEIDYCNQNLGAVLAGLVGLHLARYAKPSDLALGALIAIGAAYLLAGGYFAVT